MIALFRPAVAVLAVPFLAVCAFAVGLGCDAGALRELLREARRVEELERLQRSTFRREEARRQLVRELLDGRCSLGEALERSRELDRVCPEHAALLAYLAESNGREWFETERRYQGTLRIVRDLLSDRPEEAALACRRLEEDYRQHQDGRPAPPAAPARKQGRAVEGGMFGGGAETSPADARPQGKEGSPSKP